MPHNSRYKTTRRATSEGVKNMKTDNTSIPDNDHLHQWSREYTMGASVNGFVVLSKGFITSACVAGFTRQPAPVTNPTFDDLIYLPNGGGSAEPILAL